MLCIFFINVFNPKVIHYQQLLKQVMDMFPEAGCVEWFEISMWSKLLT